MKNTIIAVFIALLIGAGAATWAFTRAPSGAGTTITGGAAVIKEMRKLGRLETASFTIEKIIEAKKGDAGAWRNVLFGDKLLLIAHGEVIAGVDLTGLSEADVTVIDGSMHLKLAAPQVFSVRLDNEKTRVYDRDQGLLTRGDKDLESEARQAAEKSIRDAACEGDILDAASKNAVTQLKALLSALGFKDAVIEIPTGTCLVE